MVCNTQNCRVSGPRESFGILNSKTHYSLEYFQYLEFWKTDEVQKPNNSDYLVC
jgi:hypothetical protein